MIWRPLEYICGLTQGDDVILSESGLQGVRLVCKVDRTLVDKEILGSGQKLKRGKGVGGGGLPEDLKKGLLKKT